MQDIPDYHGHPNYLRTWAALVGLLGISLVAVFFDNKLAALGLIFGVAVLKALMVAGTFMHLRWEPRALWGITLFAVACLACLWLGVAPDIVPIPLVVAR